MVITLGSVREREYTLLEPGEYALTLSELDESEGQYGERLIWKFLVSPTSDPTAYLCKTNGDEYSLWAFTDVDIVIGSLAHEFAQTLSGRALGKGDEPPTEHDLLGKRCVAYITHYTPKTGKNAGRKQEKIVEGSVKPYRAAPTRAARPAPVAVVGEDGPELSRDELVAEIGRQVRKAALLDMEQAEAWNDLDLAGMGTLEMADRLETMSKAVKQAAEG